MYSITVIFLQTVYHLLSESAALRIGFGQGRVSIPVAILQTVVVHFLHDATSSANGKILSKKRFNKDRIFCPIRTPTYGRVRRGRIPTMPENTERNFRRPNRKRKCRCQTYTLTNMSPERYATCSTLKKHKIFALIR